VSAIVVLAIDKNKPNAVVSALLPVLAFFVLDAYYLSLERDFRRLYDSFVKSVHVGTAETKDVYLLMPAGGFAQRVVGVLTATLSPSVSPFYAVLVAALLVAKYLISS